MLFVLKIYRHWFILESSKDNLVSQFLTTSAKRANIESTKSGVIFTVANVNVSTYGIYSPRFPSLMKEYGYDP
jgi:hypothetical protein